MHYSKQMDQIEPAFTAEMAKGFFPNMWLDLYPLFLLFSESAVWTTTTEKDEEDFGDKKDVCLVNVQELFIEGFQAFNY